MKPAEPSRSASFPRTRLTGMGELDTAHVWAASFSSPAAAEQLFEEHYGADGTPISEFARCQGEWFYDHDWLYFEKIEDGDVSAMLRASGVPEHNASAIGRAWAERVPLEFDTIVVAAAEDFAQPRSCEIGQGRLILLGTFAHFAPASRR